MPGSPRSLAAMRSEIEHRAQLQHEFLRRGCYDVPIRHEPLPLARLLDLLGQLEYRVDALGLAVPPPGGSLPARIARWFKGLVCRALRWLLIRQVEFNGLAAEQARTTTELLGLADQNMGEILGSLQALKLRLTSIEERLAALDSVPHDCGEARQDNEDGQARGEVYLSFLDEPEPVLVIEEASALLLKLLVSEGRRALAVVSRAENAEAIREQELPVIQARAEDYLAALPGDSLGGVYLGCRACRLPAPEVGRLLGLCWRGLAKGGALIAEADNPDYHGDEMQRLRWPERRMPAELLTFLCESEGFTVSDVAFSGGGRALSASMRLPFDRKEFPCYAVLGRK